MLLGAPETERGTLTRESELLQDSAQNAGPHTAEPVQVYLHTRVSVLFDWMNCTTFNNLTGLGATHQHAADKQSDRVVIVKQE